MTEMRAPIGQEAEPQRDTNVDEMLDTGIAFDDPKTGVRIDVRLRDVKGIHDRQLIDAIGLDFPGLLNELNKRGGSDLYAAIVWFGRLVTGRDAGTYEETAAWFGYAEAAAMRKNVEAAEGDRPEA